MAIPTLAEIRPVVLAWWRAPGRPRLPRLRAMIAALITPPDSARCSVGAVITSGPPRTLTLTLSRWDANGIPLAPVTRSIVDSDLSGAAGRADLDDVSEDGEKRSRRELQAYIDAGGTFAPRPK